MARIDQLLSELRGYIDSCKPYPFSSNKIIVNRDELDELIAEIQERLPDEIVKYQKLISKKDEIIADASEEAANILDTTKKRAEELINEHKIMKEAYEQANATIQDANSKAMSIVEEAKIEAAQIRSSALQYTDNLLAQIEENANAAYIQCREGATSLLTEMENYLETIRTNRNELASENDGSLYGE